MLTLVGLYLIQNWTIKIQQKLDKVGYNFFERTVKWTRHEGMGYNKVIYKLNKMIPCKFKRYNLAAKDSDQTMYRYYKNIDRVVEQNEV